MTDYSEFERAAALATAAALRDDPAGVRACLLPLAGDAIKAACEGAILAMAEIVRDFVPADHVNHMITGAQNAAREAAEGNHP